MASQAERDIEKYLREQVEALGGRAYKWVSPGHVGVPDRICIFPYGLLVFIEVKAPGKVIVEGSPQERELIWLNSHGFLAFEVNSKEQVNSFMSKAKKSLEMLLEVHKKRLKEAKSVQAKNV